MVPAKIRGARAEKQSKMESYLPTTQKADAPNQGYIQKPQKATKTYTYKAKLNPSILNSCVSTLLKEAQFTLPACPNKLRTNSPPGKFQTSAKHAFEAVIIMLPSPEKLA